MSHERVEKNISLMTVLIVLVISVGGLVQIVPLITEGVGTQPLPGMQPRSALEVAGRDVYVREGCYNCHSQMVRTLHEETLRYGQYSTAEESVWDHPFQWGSKRTGPDLARVGGRFSDEWHRLHLINPRDVVPQSNMPGYPWLDEQMVDPDEVMAMMRALKTVGVPYSDADILAAPDAVQNKTKMQALIAFLQGLTNRPAAQDVAEVQ